MKKNLNILFIIIAILTLAEYSFIQGMFTGPFMLFGTLIIGIANAVYCAVSKRFNELALYLLCTAALCMGYLKLVFA